MDSPPPRGERSSSRRSSAALLAAGALVSLTTLALAAGCLEFGLRALGIGDDAIAGPHPWVGWMPLPRLRAEITSEDRSLGRRMRFETNSLGGHDVERRLEKLPGVRRILLLGDSFVEGSQVPFDSTLSRRLEAALVSTSPGRVEVWNCGVAGYSTTQELLYLRHVAAEYRPDHVVLCFFAGNDVADQVAPLATSLRNRPFFRGRGDSLELDRSRLSADRGPAGWLRRHSRLFGWATTQVRTIRTRLHERNAARADSAGVSPAVMVYAERPDSVWSQAWALSERLILETRDEARRQGAEFTLVSIPSGAQVHEQARTRRPGWERWESLRGFSLEEPERRLAKLAEAEGIDFVPLLPAFRAEAERTGAPLHIRWSGHWNAAGHALAAREMARHFGDANR